MEEITNTGLLYDYPELSSRLIQTSSQYATYLKSICQFPLSFKELKKVLQINETPKCIFHFINNDYIINLKVTEIKAFYNQTEVLTSQYEAVMSVAAYGAYSHAGKKQSLQNIVNQLPFDFLTLDIKSIYKAYKNRLSCQENNYVIVKTQEEFHHIIDFLQDLPLQFNLYLLKNAQILRLISLQDVNKIYRKDLNYDDYIHLTAPLRQTLIERIEDAINQFL
jgi:hypothetical protein